MSVFFLSPHILYLSDKKPDKPDNRGQKPRKLQRQSVVGFLKNGKQKPDKPDNSAGKRGSKSLSRPTFIRHSRLKGAVIVTTSHVKNVAQPKMQDLAVNAFQTATRFESFPLGEVG